MEEEIVRGDGADGGVDAPPPPSPPPLGPFPTQTINDYNHHNHPMTVQVSRSWEGDMGGIATGTTPEAPY